MSQITYYQRNRDIILNRVKFYLKNDLKNAKRASKK